MCRLPQRRDLCWRTRAQAATVQSISWNSCPRIHWSSQLRNCGPRLWGLCANCPFVLWNISRHSFGPLSASLYVQTEAACFLKSKVFLLWCWCGELPRPTKSHLAKVECMGKGIRKLSLSRTYHLYWIYRAPRVIELLAVNDRSRSLFYCWSHESWDRGQGIFEYSCRSSQRSQGTENRLSWYKKARRDIHGKPLTHNRGWHRNFKPSWLCAQSLGWKFILTTRKHDHSKTVRKVRT